MEESAGRSQSGGPVRMRVLGPGESEAVYDKRGSEPQNRTAFREAERRAKAAQFGRDELVDTRDMSEAVRSVGDGCLLLPRALSVAQQLRLIVRSYTAFCLPPNLTSLDAHFHLPSQGLWDGLQQDRPLCVRRKPHPDDSAATRALPEELRMGRAERIALLRRLRWASIGRQYNWATKGVAMLLLLLLFDSLLCLSFSFSDYFDTHVPVPDDITDVCSSLLQRAGWTDPFVPEAGIVNFYQPGDSLTGHVDRSEKNMSAPLVSVSLGASCIFLLGGPSRDDPVTPMVLHSGDVVILTGKSRTFFHGVPKILGPSLELRAAAVSDEEKLVMEVLGDGRVNLNMRQMN